MLGEITHLQTISDDLKTLTMDPHKLPPSSEQVSLPLQFTSVPPAPFMCLSVCVYLYTYPSIYTRYEVLKRQCLLMTFQSVCPKVNEKA